MLDLLIIADDFTGALDTGVHFSEYGGTVKVVTDVRFPFEEEEDIDVLVLDAETRHMDPKSAYEIVYQVAERTVRCGVPHIFKKTDSALRGNVGSELAALLAASGEKVLPFIPAFPRMNRVTRRGIHYIDGEPVSDSVFGKDPFEPVRHSYIPDVLRETGEARAECFCLGSEPGPDFQGIAVFDAESEETVLSIAGQLKAAGKLRIMAGCAGLAEELPVLLGWKKAEQSPRIKKTERFLVACGSVNPIARSQMDYAETKGFHRIRLTPEQKLLPGYWQAEQGVRELEKIRNRLLGSPWNILDSNDAVGNLATEEYRKQMNLTQEELRTGITDSIGYLVKNLLQTGAADTMMVMGGDTLLGFLKQLGVSEMTPVCEVLPGTVLSEFFYGGKQYRILSKSGGFGTEDLLVELAELVSETPCGSEKLEDIKEENIC